MVRMFSTIRFSPHRCVLAAALLLLAGGNACAPAGERSADAVLKAQADAWDAAIVRKDSVAIVANMADDFRQIDGRGNVESKASFVAGLLDPDLEIQPYTIEDFDIRYYGDVALLSGRTHMTGRYQGEEFRSHYRYIDVYARRGGRWKIVSVQISPVRE